jgi:Alpha-L-arabinofuranosidase C-terminal domain
MVNVIAPIFTKPDALFLQTVYHPLRLYAKHHQPIALDVYVDCAVVDLPSTAGVYPIAYRLDVRDLVACDVECGSRNRKLPYFMADRATKVTSETPARHVHRRALGMIVPDQAVDLQLGRNSFDFGQTGLEAMERLDGAQRKRE